MNAVGAWGVAVSALLVACAAQPPVILPPDAPTASLRICNDAGPSLRVRPNWTAIFPIPSGRCSEVRVLVGPVVLTTRPVARPAQLMAHPAARLDVPPEGAVVRFGSDGALIDVVSVEGARAWGRCNYPSGFGPRPPPPLTTTPYVNLWRSELEKWMSHNLVCEPGRNRTAPVR